MDLMTFQAKLIDYSMQYIIPNLPTIPVQIMGFNVPISSSLMQFGAGLGISMTAFSLERYAPQLKQFGILSEENQIDIERLSDAMLDQIQKVKTIKVGDFNFDESDVVKFVDYLKM